MPSSQSNNTPWVGIILISLGVLFFLENFYIIHFNLFDLWPVILIVIGVNKIRSGQRKPGIILSVLGLLFLFDNIINLPYFIEDNLGAILLIAGGFYFITKNKENTDYEVDENKIFQQFIFGGSEQQYTSQSVMGGKVTAVFGGGAVDLRGADLYSDNEVLQINCVFGGVEIFVPDHIDVVVKISPLFGAVDDLRIPPQSYDTNRKTLIIEGICLFSGIDIKSR